MEKTRNAGGNASGMMIGKKKHPVMQERYR